MTRTTDQVSDWMVNYLAAKLEVDAGLIDTSMMFDRFGLDSITAACLVADLGDHVGEVLDPSVVYDHPTIDALAEFLTQRGASNAAAHGTQGAFGSGCAP